MNDFRERLQEAARYAGIEPHQAGIATSLNLSRQTINRWFHGWEPNATMLLHIAKMWRIDATWLKNGSGTMLPTPSPNDLPNDELELLRDYRKATAQTRQKIRTIVSALRKSVVTIAATVPPMLAPSPSDAATLHNYFYASSPAVIRIAFRRWLREVLTLLIGMRNSDF